MATFVVTQCMFGLPNEIKLTRGLMMKFLRKIVSWTLVKLLEIFTFVATIFLLGALCAFIWQIFMVGFNMIYGEL